MSTPQKNKTADIQIYWNFWFLFNELIYPENRSGSGLPKTAKRNFWGLLKHRRR